MKWPLKGPPFSKSSRDGMGKRLAFAELGAVSTVTQARIADQNSTARPS